MQHIAILFTCFNRKEKTLRALNAITKALNNYNTKNKTLKATIYVTDDGCTDGTPKAIQKEFPEVKILKGDGTLFWAEGMRIAWLEALKYKYDAYLLMNDDTEVYNNVLHELFMAHEFCKENFKSQGIYLGATENKVGKLTYGGSILTNSFLAKQKRLHPNGTFQKCDLGNANIMLVTKEVVDKIGILSAGYAHGKADYDYTLMAKRHGIKVLLSSVFCGICENDHRDYYENFEKKTISERKRLLYNPTGIDFKSQLKFNKKFFPFRYPFVLFFGYFKVYFPILYLNLLSLRKLNHKQ